MNGPAVKSFLWKTDLNFLKITAQQTVAMLQLMKRTVYSLLFLNPKYPIIHQWERRTDSHNPLRWHKTFLEWLAWWKWAHSVCYTLVHLRGLQILAILSQPASHPHLLLHSFISNSACKRAKGRSWPTKTASWSHAQDWPCCVHAETKRKRGEGGNKCVISGRKNVMVRKHAWQLYLALMLLTPNCESS